MTNIIQSIMPWLTTHGLKIIIFIVVAFLIWKFSGLFIEKFIRKTIISDRYDSKEAEKKREDTLIKIFNGTVGVLVWVVILIMILAEVGVEVGPMIAAAGIAGLAFGFGGQYLIRDLITGFFIILENQYRVGDVVCFDTTCGEVEDISLRMTTLRDLDGKVHHIPHGEIKKVTNMAKQFSRVNVDVGIAYASDLEKVIKVINKIGEDIANDPEWKELIISPPKFLRVDEFADSAIMIKILGDTQPLKQWGVAGELRKRIKITFDKEGIEIPFPQRVIHQAK